MGESRVREAGGGEGGEGDGTGAGVRGGRRRVARSSCLYGSARLRRLDLSTEEACAWVAEGGRIGGCGGRLPLGYF